MGSSDDLTSILLPVTRVNVLNVLQLIPTLDRSGAEKQMVVLAKGLPRDRFHVEVATLTRRGAFEAELNASGISVTTIGKRWKLDPLAIVRLANFSRLRKFDVVQTWIFAANTYWSRCGTIGESTSDCRCGNGG